jgi:excisionase family DNA binding protein
MSSFETYRREQAPAAPRRDQKLLTPGEVAKIFRVDPKTVSRWAEAGRVPGAFKTPGRHWRFPAESIEILLAVQEVAS